MLLIIFGLALIIATFIGFLVLNAYITDNYTGNERLIYNGLAGVANGAIIFVFTEIYKIACLWANNVQNHKYQSQYEGRYIFKRAFFDFVLSYINLTYYAFYSQNFGLLANNFITIIVSKNLLFAFQVKSLD